MLWEDGSSSSTDDTAVTEPWQSYTLDEMPAMDWSEFNRGAWKEEYEEQMRRERLRVNEREMRTGADFKNYRRATLAR